MSKKKIAIIGSGPSGLMAAEQLALKGHKVTVYEQATSPARKLFLAGLGGLNLTHSEAFDDFLSRYQPLPKSLHAALCLFSSKHLVEWCEKDLQIKTVMGSSKRIYPEGMKASPFMRAWLKRLEELGVQFQLQHFWKGWSETGELIFDGPEKETLIKCDATLLALGGASWPRIGTNGNWIPHLERYDISVCPFKPSNMGINSAWSPIFLEQFEGKPIKSVAFTFADRRCKGEVVVTHYGLEGGPVYTLSSHVRNALEKNETVILEVDGKPDLSEEDIVKHLEKARAKDSLTSQLRKTLKLTPIVIGLLREGVGKELKKDYRSLAHAIKHIPLRINGTQGLERAISSSGGVAFEEIDDSFMLKKKPGVFVVGEMLDWEAPTGGYLLQACFATGFAASCGVEKWLSTAHC